MLKLDNSWPQTDEVPWCSAFVNYVAWLLRLPRTKDLRARSWLTIGTPIAEVNAVQGFDVCIFRRAGGQAGPEVIDAPGHVAFFSSFTGDICNVLGGNQGDSVTVAGYKKSTLLGIRRLGGG